MAAQGWDIASETDAPPAVGGWDVAHEEPIETANARMARHQALLAKAPSFAHSAKQVANDVLDAAGGALSVPAEGVVGAASHVLGQSQDVHDSTVKAVHDFIAGPENKDLSAAGSALATTAPAKAVAGVAHEGHRVLSTAVGPDAARSIESVGGDLLKAAPVIGPAMRAVAPVLGIDPALASVPAIAEGAASTATAPDDVLRAAGYRVRAGKINTMTGAVEKPSTVSKIGEVVGGSEATRADNLAHNRPVSNGWAATDIDLPRDTVLTPENIAKAEVKPSATYDRVRGALADRAPVSPETAAALRATNAPDSLGRGLPTEHGNSMELLSTEPMNAGDMMDRISKLRQEGYKRTTPATAAGQIDPAVEAYGNAQLDAANALEKELNTRISNQAPKLLGDYQAARKMFAKIGAVKRSMKGYDIDPSKLAKASAKSDALDGGLKIVADAHIHAPEDVGVHVPVAAGLGDSAVVAGAGGGASGLAAMAFGHPVTGALLATLPAAQYGIRKAIAATRGERAAAELDASAHGPLSHYFRQPEPSPVEQFGLTPPPGQVFEPHQPSVLRSGEDVPLAESTQNPRTSLSLQPPGGPVIEPHQPGVLRTGEQVPAAESTQTPQPSVQLTAPSGQAFDAHQRMLPMGAEPTVDIHHGSTAAEPFNKFEDSKIGAGSGMQARGYGHYVTDSKAEASGHAGSSGGYVMHGKLPQDTAGRMLDLDRPLYEQPGAVAALSGVKGINMRWTGEQLHAKIADGTVDVGIKVDKSGKAIANWLASKGIPGAKFLSSKAGKKTGARTYIVYNPDDVAITGNTRIKGNLGDAIAPKTQVGGGLTADDLKLAE